MYIEKKQLLGLMAYAAIEFQDGIPPIFQGVLDSIESEIDKTGIFEKADAFSLSMKAFGLEEMDEVQMEEYVHKIMSSIFGLTEWVNGMTIEEYRVRFSRYVVSLAKSQSLFIDKVVSGK